MYSRAKAWPLFYSPADDYFFYFIYICIYTYIRISIEQSTRPGQQSAGTEYVIRAGKNDNGAALNFGEKIQTRHEMTRK